MGILSYRSDRPVAVIGDIHGCSEALAPLLRLIGPMPVIVVGDVGDRGPDTKGVVELLVERGAIGVRGNHDEWLISWACGEGFDTVAFGEMMGGGATLRSYGVRTRDPVGVHAERDRVPRTHAEWLARLSLAIDLEVCGERYWVVHAGIPSGRDYRGLTPEGVVPFLVEKNEWDLLWSSNDPETTVPVDRPVIMGHAAQPRPRDFGHVIAIDTGAGTRRDGRLSAVILPERRFISVEAGRE